MTGGYPSKKNLNPNSPTHRWSKSLLEDEVAGVKTIKILLKVFDKVKEISVSQEAVTFDSILIEALEALKIQRGAQTLDDMVKSDDKNEEE